MPKPTPSFDLVEASFEEILDALADGTATSVELTARHLARVGAFDRDGARLNAVPLLNPEALAEAAASDRRRREGHARPLEGIPFTVKDSYMVTGLPVTAGSPAFRHLVAQWDAFAVATLRAAGAVLVGRTTMPPMADGGMQRGVFGRAESPYNPRFLAAAYASGSSNGSGVATAASFAAFSMGGETVSSGRSPASNNGLCAYTPSWGILSMRGTWPLFPARDVVVPYTRSMPDLLRLLDVLVQDDEETRGDFWRHQSVVELPRPSEHRPASYLALQDPDAVRGKRFGVPAMYLGKDPAFPIAVRPSILALWDAARARLESLGAEVVEVDFPVIERYEDDHPTGENVGRLGVLPDGWMDTEFNHFLAYGWDDFLRANGDPAIPSLAAVDPDEIFPQPPGSLPDRYEEVEDYPNRYRATVALAREGIPDPRDRADFADGLRALVRLREDLFEGWLADRGLDGVIFPANADVGAWNADVDERAADHAWSNGVLFSNGNYAIRHLGIPTVTVPMGLMADIGMPVGLTFAGPAYCDPALLSYAAAFEAGGTGSLRPVPAYAPALPDDRFAARLGRVDAVFAGEAADGPPPGDVLGGAPEDGTSAGEAPGGVPDGDEPEVTLEAALGPETPGGARLLTLAGHVRGADPSDVRVTVNGDPVAVEADGERWAASTVLPAVVTPPEVGGNPLSSRAVVVAVVADGRGVAAGAFAEV
ncbi:putative amidase [Nostocoides japonicum T1-X7]|uniref:Putative amidase n=1 Tax=Nostocoides japonicum T1-X7 TaxID=1194083 RepID=A0A077LXU9_9MICO|nr:amidase [Tetrasphaera japonica]CCH78728.1 putative amidase [Tetrasphaera japonica T1-X7]